MSARAKYSLLFAGLAALFFIPFLGGVHLFDWDEINFAEISREMIRTGDYLRVYIDYQPFWEKPPLFIWMQVLSMKLFGINEFSARFPDAICGILSLILLFRIGQRLFDTKFGLLWAGFYFGSILPFLYFKSGIIDPWFNLFIFYALYLFIRFYWTKDRFDQPQPQQSAWGYLILSSLVLGLGILTKGPVAYLIFCITLAVYWIMQKFRLYIKPVHFLVFTIGSLIVMFTWFGIEYILHGPWFINEFIKYNYRLFSTPDAGHAGFPGYHFVVLLVGVFPASIFTIRSFFRMERPPMAYQKDFIRWMKILFWVVLILFTIVKSKIVHYSSLCYFPMTFLAALSFHSILEGKITLAKWMRAGLWIIAGVFILACLALPFVGQHFDVLKPLFQKDKFALANLQAQVNWTYTDLVPGVILLAVMIISMRFFRKGQYSTGVKWLLGGVPVFVMAALIFFINKIEAYSQRAAVEFCEQRIGENCYVMVKGYKSYVQLFYTRKPPVTNDKSYDPEWLLTGDIDKPVYVITKVDKLNQMEGYEGLTRLYEKNGFVFFKRNAGK